MTQSHKSECPAATGRDAEDQSTNESNFATGSTQRQASIQTPVPTTTPIKAAILTALTKLIDPPDVLSVQSLTTKKRIKAAMGGTAK